jgi:hypothetical protein
MWESNQIQDPLQLIRETWCEYEANVDVDGLRPAWARGDSLWQYSRTDYHYNRITNRTKEFIRKHNLNPDQIDDFYERFKPKHGTIESLVLYKGNHHLLTVYAAVAKRYS